MSTAATAAPAAPTPEVMRQRRMAQWSSLIGTTIEWYEYYIYGTMAALAFPTLFFPAHDRIVSLLASYASFGLAFVIRPIGAMVFGHFGDRIGRKSMLITTLVMTGLATFLIGALPTHAQIGAWAAGLLLFLRLVQGFGVGGEWGGAVLSSLEWGDQKKRGASGSWPQMGTSVGLILATTVGLISAGVSGDAFLRWGWRIPFLFAGVLVVVGLLMRLSLSETPSFAEKKAKGDIEKSPVPYVIRHYPKQLILSALLRMSENMPFYIFTSFILDYATKRAGYSRTFVLLGTLVAAIIDLFLLPTFARLGDRWGRRKMYLLGCVVLAVMAVPYFMMIDSHNKNLAFIAIALSLLPHAIQYGSQASIIAEQYPVRVRYAGAGIGYQLASIVAGGPAPIIATLLVAKYASGQAVAAYLIFGAVVAAIALYLMPKTEHEM